MEKFDDVKAYKEALLSDIYTPKMIMSNITIPEKVYKYRALNFDYLKDSLEGKVYFSLPSEINANDDDDCKVNVDEEKCIEYFMEQCNCSRVSAKEKFSIVNNHWIIGLQDKIKIGCFTTVVPSDSNAEYMWNEFADNGKGYCVEYSVNKDIFYPNEVVFLPVCYEESPYDNTDYVIRIINHVLKKMDKSENPALDSSFVAQGYNRAIFKLNKYIKEDEWRVIIPCNRYDEYFDNNMDRGGIKNMNKSITAVYVRRDFEIKSDCLDLMKKTLDDLQVDLFFV